MEIAGKIAVVTGAASGIGRATAKRFAAGGAKAVVVADMNEAGTLAVANEIAGYGMRCDVSKEQDIRALVDFTKQKFGRIDVFFSNAGILGEEGGFDLSDELWDRMWRIHSMSHVWAARHVVPDMLTQEGGGYVLSTASAAGLLTILESAPYAVTKHAAVAFAEWLRITYGRKGLRVSCLCPQAVATGMVTGDGGSAGVDGVLTAEAVAEEIINTMREESFLVLPHPQVEQYMKTKGTDYARWIGGMQKYKERLGIKP